MMSLRCKVHAGGTGGAGGFTLLEVLAVVVILSLVASAAMMGLSSANDEAVMRAARSVLQELDAKTRLYSRAGHRVSLRVGESGAIEVREHGSDRNRIAFTAVSAQIQLTLQEVDSGETVIQFDRLGRSPDYRVVLQSAAGMERWHVCGLTGWFSKAGDP